jgi:hypothetical protein
MTSITALLASMAVANCAARSIPRMNIPAAIAAGVPQSQTKVIDDPALLRRYVEQLRIGSPVKIELATGEKFSAILVAVELAGVVVKPKTRVPEPARTIPFDTIVRVEPAGDGTSRRNAIAITAAAAAGGFLLAALLFNVW